MILVSISIYVASLNKKLVKTTHKLIKRDSDYFTLLKQFHNLKRAAELTVAQSKSMPLLEEADKTLYKLQELFYAHPDNDYLVDVMYRLKRFLDIAKETKAKADIQRVNSYCNSLKKSDIVEFYEVKND